MSVKKNKKKNNICQPITGILLLVPVLESDRELFPEGDVRGEGGGPSCTEDGSGGSPCLGSVI